MATLSTWEAGLTSRPKNQATQLAGAALAVRDQLARGEVFATALTRVAGDNRHYDQLTRWNEYAPFLALTGP